METKPKGQQCHRCLGIWQGRLGRDEQILGAVVGGVAAVIGSFLGNKAIERGGLALGVSALFACVCEAPLLEGPSVPVASAALVPVKRLKRRRSMETKKRGRQ